MTNLIAKRLKEIEEKYEVKILFAVESGSRAWGFSSDNSDWDVRFIYVHKLPWYVNVQDNRDVIEIMEGDLDFSGWELRKALNLLAKGNPPLLEWLGSPIVYKEDPEFVLDLLELAINSFDPRAAIYHYLGMAKRNYNQYIKDKTYVKLKKYLYVIRPLLSCMYIQETGSMAPTLMDASMPFLSGNIAYSEVEKLITAKKAGAELDMGSSNPILNQFIEETMLFFDLYVLDLKSPTVDYEALNKCLFKQVMDFTNET
jgi:predicted nucleotidyltransferase